MTEIVALKAKLASLRGAQSDQPYLADEAKKGGVQKVRSTLKTRRVLVGHFGKIYGMDWSPKDPEILASASQDGKLLIWNALSTNKIHAINLRSQWVLCCGFSPSGRLVGSGGLDNLCTVWRLPDWDKEEDDHKMAGELIQHEGYISCIKFVGTADQEALTASGDGSVILWDLHKNRAKTTFAEHSGDVMSIDLLGDAKDNVFISGSIDTVAKLWDARTGTKSLKTFHGHESDINAVRAFPGGLAFGTGSDDSTLRLWDLRAYRELSRFASSKLLSGVTSVAFSKSGRLFFGGHEDASLSVWDTLCGGEPVEQTIRHENRISSIGVSADGSAICTASWDQMLKVWV